MTEAGDWLEIESLDLEAQGVARNAAGKVVFIEGALPGEEVQARVNRRKPQWEQATMTALRRESALRVSPRCAHFGLQVGACGGCKMQHLDDAAQLAIKQRVLEDSLQHLAKVRPDLVLRPIAGPPWGYRERARLSVRHVARKGTVLVGFHERKSSYVADMQSCAVLPPRVSELLLPLRALVQSMDGRDRMPQIEVAAGDSVLALVLRHLEPLTSGDVDRLRAFAATHGVQWWTQAKGPASVRLLDESLEVAELAYALPSFGLRLGFRPTDFTQVNARLNAALVERAVRLLAPQASERVIDWFCGLGNFSLPIARSAREVLGIEGSEELVQRAAENARRNGLGGHARFAARDLFEMTPERLVDDGVADKWLVDPPRDGALALVRSLAEVVAGALPAGWRSPARIVYVSCNPATLARDAGLLVHQAGYRCAAAGVINMFPHTAHVESIAVFERSR